MTAASTTVAASNLEPTARGVTHIADRVVAKIAARAAHDVDDVRPAPPTGLARLAHRSAEPTVHAHVRDGAVTLDMELGISYPEPIRVVAANVRNAVRAVVERLTGLDVDAIRIELVDLPIDRAATRRVI